MVQCLKEVCYIITGLAHSSRKVGLLSDINECIILQSEPSVRYMDLTFFLIHPH